MARRTQIVIKDMGTNFAPANIVCIIPDPRDLSVQLYANDNGGMFFTLPIDHPAVSLIRPLKQHYFIQRLDGSSYVTIQGGIITDYDAANNEVVINGVDYMSALDKYYTPINGPKVGDKAIPSADTTDIGGSPSTPKAIIDEAILRDKEKRAESYSVAMSDSAEPKLGHIDVFESGAIGATVDQVFAEYETDGGNKTGVISLSGKLTIYRNLASVLWVDGETSTTVRGEFAVTESGVLVYAEPGGPLYNFTRTTDFAADTTDISYTFDLKFRPVSKYDSTNEDHDDGTGLTRRVSVLTEGVSYEFYVIPWYTGTLKKDSNNTTYTQKIWGKPSGKLKVNYTSGLTTDTLSNAFANAMSNTSSPLYVLNRKNDYPSVSGLVPDCATGTLNGVTHRIYKSTDNLAIYAGDSVKVTNSGSNGDYTVSQVTRCSTGPTWLTEVWVTGSGGTYTGDTDAKIARTHTVLDPIIKFTTLEQINIPTNQSSHPYITAGQNPVGFLRDLSEVEVGTRTDKSKVVFNYYGVPGATANGTKLIVNHRVSGTAQYLLNYPGNIKEFNVVSKRSSKINSVRVISSTPFLIGASTEGSGGSKSQGIVRVGKYLAGDPALPQVVSQDGFVSAQGAANYGMGILNDFNLDTDVTKIRVSLRTEVFGPIGVTGTPKLGESVKVVIKRKASNVGADSIEDIYNIGGMEWGMSTDGHETLYLDLVKPTKFKGPAISWGSQGASPEPGDIDTSSTRPKKKKKKPKHPGDRGPIGTWGPGNNGGAGFNQSWWGPGGYTNVGGLNDRFNIQPGRGGAYDHYLYVMAQKPYVPPSVRGPGGWGAGRGGGGGGGGGVGLPKTIAPIRRPPGSTGGGYGQGGGGV